MKTNFYKILMIFAVIGLIACEDDEGLDQANVPMPQNLSLEFSVTQDNSGVVSMIPKGNATNSFKINFGDESEPVSGINPGDVVENQYAEGSYQVELTGFNIKNDSVSVTQDLVVSFQPPQNLDVVIENDGVVSNTVNVTVNADFAFTYEVDFGEEGVDSIVQANVEETATYTYQNPGLYDINIVVSGAASETTSFTEEDFEVTEILEPVVGAPSPTQPAQAVISIFSDSYDSITVSEFPTEWSDTDFEEIQIGDNNVVKYTNLAFTGIVTDYANPTDLTDMDFVHFDYWTPNATDLGFKMVNTVISEEDIKDVGTPTIGEWVGVDIALDDYNMDRSQVTQLLFDALGSPATVYIDNLYFYKDIPEAPAVAAPTPTVDASNVLSIYSDAYSSITLNEIPTSWSSSGFEEVQIDNNNTIKLSDFDFVGIVTNYDSPTDLSGFSSLHFDYWTPNAEELGIKLVNTALDPIQEDLEDVGTVTLGEWVSVDIPLADFNMDLSQVTQLIFDNLVENDNDDSVFIDNFYFYN